MPWDLRLLVLGCIYVPAIAGLLLAGAFVYYTATIPNPMAMRQKQSAPVVRILARDGSLLTERGGAAPYVAIGTLPRHLIHAVLAIEDRRFYLASGRRPDRPRPRDPHQPESRPLRAGRLDHHAAARQEHLPHLRAHA